MPDVFQLLEFDRVIPLLHRHVKTASGREIISGLKPLSDPSMIKSEFDLIRPLIEHIRVTGPLEFVPIEDIRLALSESVKESFLLDSFEILEIRKTLTVYDTNAAALAGHAELSARFPRYKSLQELPGRISKILDDDGNVLDSASEDLRKIRKRKNSIRGDIQRKLSSLMEASSLQSVLQDRIVTIRDGRFVIPLRSQSKNSVKSDLNFIIHSYSKTGETAFVEPESVIALNNEIVEIDEAELEEIRRILSGLTAEIGILSGDIRNVWDKLGRLEALHARALFAREYRCCLPEIVADRAELVLVRAYHPLLGLDSVPVTFETGRDYQGIVISGPNAGGKTVTLKIAGLLTLMALSAIPIPAGEGSRVGLFSSVLAEIGDDQSISENLSSFSGHIRNISRILETGGERTLVLIDEIASSTEPREGEALGRAIIKKLLDTGARFIVTTHFSGIKELGFTDTRLRNAFMEFDEERLAPLYRLNTGGTGSSYALKVAKKYGLPPGVVDDAQNFLESRATDIDKLLRSLEDERNSLFRKKGIVESQLSELRDLKNRSEKLVRELEEKKETADRKATTLLRRELDEALREISELKNELKKKRVDDVKKADETIETARAVLKESEQEILEKQKKRLAEVTPGMTVYVGSYGREGTIEAIQHDRIKIRIGIMSVIVDQNDLYEAAPRPQSGHSATYRIADSLQVHPSLVDLRGMTLEEAVRTLDKAMDLAVMNGTPSVHIIHGKGEGVLRKGVWDYLKDLDTVKSYDYAKPEEGGQGKTVVFLK